MTTPVRVPKPMPPCPTCGRRELTAVVIERPRCDVHNTGTVCPEGHATCDSCGARSCIDIARSLASGDEALAMLRRMSGKEPS